MRQIAAEKERQREDEKTRRVLEMLTISDIHQVTIDPSAIQYIHAETLSYRSVWERKKGVSSPGEQGREESK